MVDIPRRTLAELSFIYERDPNLRDIYVEGPFDASIISWFLRENSINDAVVYSIESVDISDGDLIASDLSGGNRDRVIFLARFLDGKHVQKVACIIDADFSYLSGQGPVNPPLFMTDFSCMEMYFFTERCFAKLFSICYRKFDWPVQDIMRNISWVAQEFFLYRWANNVLGWGMDWLERIVCMNMDGWEVRLDEDGYITRFLNKNGRLANKVEFEAQVRNLRSSLRGDRRFQMNGHDLISVLAWYVRQRGISGQKATMENVHLFMPLTLDHRELLPEPMFEALVQRIE